MIKAFLLEESGVDLVEYSLLLAFVCLAGAASYIGLGTSLSGLWTTANNRLAAANNNPS